MGQLFSFPLRQVPIAFNPTCYYTCIGNRRKEDYAGDTTFFHQLQRGYWEDLLVERKIEIEAKKKFKEQDINIINKYLEKFPKFTSEKVADLKLQFQAFDLNNDGLIDFHEMMQVLDDLGDTSSLERREKYFQEIDEDSSGAIDFEEFMGLIYEFQFKNRDATENMGLLYKVGQDNLNVLRQLTLSEKLLNGLF